MRYACVHAPPSLMTSGSVFGLKKLVTKICSPAVQSRQGVPKWQALQMEMAACLFDSRSLDAASEWDTSNRLKKKRKRGVFAGTIRRLGGAQAGSWQAITPPTAAPSGIVRTVWKLTRLMMRHVKTLLTWESRWFLAWLFCWTKQPSSQGCCCAVFLAATCAFPRAVCARVSMKMRLFIQGRKLLILNGSKAFGVFLVVVICQLSELTHNMYRARSHQVTRSHGTEVELSAVELRESLRWNVKNWRTSTWRCWRVPTDVLDNVYNEL